MIKKQKLRDSEFSRDDSPDINPVAAGESEAAIAVIGGDELDAREGEIAGGEEEEEEEGEETGRDCWRCRGGMRGGMLLLSVYGDEPSGSGSLPVAFGTVQEGMEEEIKAAEEAAEWPSGRGYVAESRER